MYNNAKNANQFVLRLQRAKQASCCPRDRGQDDAASFELFTGPVNVITVTSVKNTLDFPYTNMLIPKAAGSPLVYP